MTRRTTGVLTAAATATLVACALTPTAAFAASPDTTRPSVSVDAPAAGSAFRPADTGSLELSATDEGGIASVSANLYDAANAKMLDNLGSESKIGGDTAWKGSFPLPTDLAPGEYTIRVSVKDVSGNTKTVSRTLTIDTTRPVLSIDTPATDSVFRSSKVGSVALSATDNVGLASATANLYDAANSKIIDNLGSVKIGGDIRWNDSFALPTGLAEGVYTVRANLKDLAGNSHTLTRTFTVDDTRPVLSIDAPAEGATFKPADVGSVALTATDNVALESVGVNLYDEDNAEMVDNIGSAAVGGGAAWSDSFSLPADLADGVYTIRANAKDRAGLSHTVTRQFTVDTAKPGVTATLSDGGGSVIVEGTDNHGLDYVAANVYGPDGTLVTPQSSPRNLGLASYAHTFALPTGYEPGVYAIKAGAEDAAGNVSVVVLNFTVAEESGEVEGPAGPVVTEPEIAAPGEGGGGQLDTGDEGDEGGEAGAQEPTEESENPGDGAGENDGQAQFGESETGGAGNGGTGGGASTPAAETPSTEGVATTATVTTATAAGPAKLASTGVEPMLGVAGGALALLLGILAFAMGAHRTRRAEG